MKITELPKNLADTFETVMPVPGVVRRPHYPYVFFYSSQDALNAVSGGVREALRAFWPASADTIPHLDLTEEDNERKTQQALQELHSVDHKNWFDSMERDFGIFIIRSIDSDAPDIYSQIVEKAFRFNLSNYICVLMNDCSVPHKRQALFQAVYKQIHMEVPSGIVGRTFILDNCTSGGAWLHTEDDRIADEWLSAVANLLVVCNSKLESEKLPSFTNSLPFSVSVSSISRPNLKICQTIVHDLFVKIRDTYDAGGKMPEEEAKNKLNLAQIVKDFTDKAAGDSSCVPTKEVLRNLPMVNLERQMDSFRDYNDNSRGVLKAMSGVYFSSDAQKVLKSAVDAAVKKRISEAIPVFMAENSLSKDFSKTLMSDEPRDSDNAGTYFAKNWKNIIIGEVKKSFSSYVDEWQELTKKQKALHASILSEYEEKIIAVPTTEAMAEGYSEEIWNMQKDEILRISGMADEKTKDEYADNLFGLLSQYLKHTAIYKASYSELLLKKHSGDRKLAMAELMDELFHDDNTDVLFQQATVTPVKQRAYVNMNLLEEGQKTWPYQGILNKPGNDVICLESGDRNGIEVLGLYSIPEANLNSGREG